MFEWISEEYVGVYMREFLLLIQFPIKAISIYSFVDSVVVKDLRLKDEDKDEDLSFKDKDKDLGRH